MTTTGSVSRVEKERRSSLATKIRWVFLSFAVASLLVVGGLLTYLSYRAQQRSLSQSQLKAAESVGLFISSYLQASLRDLLLFEQTQNLAAMDLQEQQQTLEDLLRSRGDVLDEIALLDGAGHEVVRVSQYRTYLPGDLVSRADSTLFAATSRGENAIGSVYLSEYSLPLVDMAVPVHNEQGEVAGALLAEVSIRQMWDAVAGVKLGETAYAYIVDEEGTLVAHTTLATFFAHRFADLSAEPEVRDALTHGQARAPDLYRDFTGERVTSAHAPIQVENAQWVAVVAVPVNEAYADIYDMLLYLAGILLLSLVVAGVVGTLIPRAIVRPLNLLEEGASIIGAGDLNHRIEVKTRDEIGRLAQAFNSMASRLQGLFSTLERRVADRTRDLEHRAVQLATAAEVGQAAASILELEPLTHRVVQLVRERFDLYYAGLFLLDDAGEYALLEAGTGESGRLMKEQGHKLQVGGSSMVGSACAQHEARIALDVGEEPARFNNPLLPLTRSEMALPLMVGDRVLGALDVQSTQQAAFSQEDIAVLQLVANQAAVAVDNARKFSEEATLLEATNPLFRISRRLAAAATTDDVVQVIVRTVAETEADGCAVALFGSADGQDHEGGTITFLGAWHRWREPGIPLRVPLPPNRANFPPPLPRTFWTVEDVLEDERIDRARREKLVGHEVRAVVNVPLQVGERVVGFVDVQRATAGPFSPVSIRLFEALTDQAAVALERARLLEQSQQQAARERAIRDISDRVTASFDLDTILRTTVEEIGRFVGASGGYVELGVTEAWRRSEPEADAAPEERG